MNENLNLVEILKDCPCGTKLYSTIHGEVEFEGINDKHNVYKIEFKAEDEDICGVTIDGRLASYYNGECILFPSKDQRDWSKFKIKKPKFDPNTLQPYDKVLVRYTDAKPWKCAFYSYRTAIYKYTTSDSAYIYCIPYNDETKHLVGTNEEAPEYYRYWED